MSRAWPDFARRMTGVRKKNCIQSMRVNSSHSASGTRTTGMKPGTFCMIPFSRLCPGLIHSLIAARVPFTPGSAGSPSTWHLPTSAEISSASSICRTLVPKKSQNHLKKIFKNPAGETPGIHFRPAGFAARSLQSVLHGRLFPQGDCRHARNNGKRVNQHACEGETYSQEPNQRIYQELGIA